MKQVLKQLRKHPLYLKLEKRFLEFSNFYRCFIHNFSFLKAPFTTMLCGKPKSLSWTPEAQSFSQLKKAFITTPILRHPDPQAPFLVEVDASTTRVGAAVSQCNGEPPRLHPCALYSRKLTSAEQNYNIGSHELLAIKLALEEWRHWLEGAQLPFTVITDHNHLQYLRETKRLNPRQARRALFFSRFNFSITYCPGGCNMKVDALSGVHSPDSPVEPEPIFPPAMIVSPIQWDITECIRAATHSSTGRPRREDVVMHYSLSSLYLCTPLMPSSSGLWFA